MRPQVPGGLRRAVSRLLREPPLDEQLTFEATLFDDIGRRYWFGDVFPDVRHFRYQHEVLQNLRVSQYVAIFKDDGPAQEPLPIPVRVPDLQKPQASYNRFLDFVSKWDLQLEKVDAESLEGIFVDRLSEFLAVQNSTALQATTLTTVHSNRKGDTVLCAKGYFTSTGMGFGVSTPAQGFLTGRYSFGIIDSGIPRFYPVVWSCPTTARIKLP
jgi:hypothetical protein